MNTKKTTAIICEYNPFHAGHRYHLDRTRAEYPDARILCLMSGNFVQRGEPAVMTKYARAASAVKAGADAVVELPACVSLSSAKEFAFGAVKMLNAIPSVDRLSFGAVNCTASDLEKLTDLLTNETPELSGAIKENLKKGVSFSKAKIDAVKSIYGELGNVLDDANNILGVEYLSAIRLTKSKIKPLVIPRKGDCHSDEVPASAFPSATAVRNLIANRQAFRSYLPEFDESAPVLDQAAAKERLYLLLREKLLRVSPEEIGRIADVKEGFEYSAIASAQHSGSYGEFIAGIKTKRFTRAKINRIILQILLEIRKDDRNFLAGGRLYRILAYRDLSLPIEIPDPVMSVKDFDRITRAADRAVMEKTIEADRLYDLAAGFPHSDGRSFFTVRIK